MSPISELRAASEAVAVAAADGRWDDAALGLRWRADLLDGSRGFRREELGAALRAGEEARAALRRLRAEFETELLNLRAARRSVRVWRPYREACGGTVDVSS